VEYLGSPLILPAAVRGRRLPHGMGALIAVALVGACTAAVYPLQQLTTVAAVGVVYLFAVAVVSVFWGFWLSRRRASEAERRRAEADLTSDIAQLLLARADVEDALALIGRQIARVFELRWAMITLGDSRQDPRRQTITLQANGRRLGELVIPADLPEAVVTRLQDRVVPALSAVLELALERARLVAETVQTEGLRRSEAVKTAVLRTVSHDLRSPVTAMVTAGAAVRDPELSPDERDELGRLVVSEGSRLARLIDDLLDLSKLEANSAHPRLAVCSVEEVIDAALAGQTREADFRVRIDPALPAVRADFVQVERVLANLFENAARYCGGEPVTIRARPAHDRAIIRVIDHGPGVPEAERDRVFEPFYRSQEARKGHLGSGLGLAIARGFVEANGGRIWVESTPGQGSTFNVELLATDQGG
jgi:two-component system, OmpR family, sensor histidine kinase KdpD